MLGRLASPKCSQFNRPYGICIIDSSCCYIKFYHVEHYKLIEYHKLVIDKGTKSGNVDENEIIIICAVHTISRNRNEFTMNEESWNRFYVDFAKTMHNTKKVFFFCF